MTMVYIGIVIVFAIMAVIGVLSSRKVSDSKDFTVAGKGSGPVMVAGTILGAIVGAGGTIGTAETAFKIGIVGWWQTLGLGLGVLVLSLCWSQMIYKKYSDAETIPQILAGTFGDRIIPITAIFSAVAIFFSILSQTKGFIPLLTSIVPVSISQAAIICVLLVLAFVLFGGIMSTSIGGVVKMILILIALIAGSIVAFNEFGSFSNVRAALPASYFNMFARGVSTDIAKGLSFVLGVLVTQTYIQAVLSAKDAKAARNGTMLGALVTIPVGLFAVMIGWYMKVNYPDMNAAEALPRFMLLKFPPAIAGIFIGALMLAALGSNAGLTLGVSTLLSRDVYQRFKKKTTDKEMLRVIRTIIVVVVCLSGYLAVSKAGELIQTFIFLSFGMRTCVFLIPLLFIFYYKGTITPQAGMASCLAGPIVNIIWNLWPPFDFDPLYTGIIASFLAFIIANQLTKNKYELEVGKQKGKTLDEEMKEGLKKDDK